MVRAGLLDGSVGFGGEESAGASFLQRDGSVWTTDKDGIILALLASEITAVTGLLASELYSDLTGRYARRPTPASTPRPPGSRRRRWPGCPRSRSLPPSSPGEDHRGADQRARQRRPDRRPQGRDRSGWFAARPSGTEDVYRLYAESFRGPEHLAVIQDEARAIMAAALDSGKG